MMENIHIREMLETYVDELRDIDVPNKAERWFPQHEDNVTTLTKTFHEHMGKLWRDQT